MLFLSFLFFLLIFFFNFLAVSEGSDCLDSPLAEAPMSNGSSLLHSYHDIITATVGIAHSAPVLRQILQRSLLVYYHTSEPYNSMTPFPTNLTIFRLCFLFVQNQSGPGRKHKRCGVQGTVVVAVNCHLGFLGPLPQGNLDVGGGVFTANKEAELTRRVGGDGGVGILNYRESFTAGVTEFLKQVEVKPNVL